MGLPSFIVALFFLSSSALAFIVNDEPPSPVPVLVAELLPGESATVFTGYCFESISVQLDWEFVGSSTNAVVTIEAEKPTSMTCRDAILAIDSLQFDLKCPPM